MFAAVGLQRPVVSHVPPVGQVLLPPAVHTVVQTWKPSVWNVRHIGASVVVQSCSVAHES